MDDCVGHKGTKGSRDSDGIASRRCIGLKAMRHRPTLGVCSYGQSGETVEGATGSGAAVLDGEDKKRTSNRLMIFVFDLDDGLACCTLSNVVERVFAIKNGDVQHHWSWRHGLRQERCG